jgi:DNA replication ATP-dependent helicase Dna2
LTFGQRLRSQWHRSKSNPAAPLTADPPRPLPVSEKTKSKLLAYQFDPEGPGSHIEDAKDEPAEKGPPTAPDNVSNAVTPAARSAWQDLLGRPEGPREVESHSPSERILWRNDDDSSQPVALSPLLARKQRKRARSSSPVSSPASKHTTPAVDVKKLAQALQKTPRADPAIELWDRFSVSGRNASPSGLTNPLLAQLMVSSSPRPRDANRLASERPLRKAISCGSHWPKRRKLDRADSDAADPAAAPSQPDSKSFMVSALLETVNGELTKSKLAQAKPRSPHPSPSRMKSSGDKGRARQPPSRQRSESSPLAKKSTVAPAEDNVNGTTSGHMASSDYGDDDFDDETLLELDASILGQGDDPTLVGSSEELNPQAPPVQKTVGDEFGDLDDDFFDGAEDLVAEAEARHLSQVPSQAQRHDRSAKASGDDDDVYGDDFEDVDFDAIELAATRATAPPLSSNVRSAG